MLKGIKHGVDLINDVSGFKFDPLALQKISNYKIQSSSSYERKSQHYAKESKI